MSTIGTQPSRRNTVFSALSERRRRRLLGLLADRSEELPELELTVKLAIRETDRSLDALTDEEIERVHRLLYHQDLPLLDSVSLVDWDRRGETVRRTDHAVYTDPTFRAVIDDEDAHWDDILPNLADTRRRRLLRILSDSEDRTAVDTLATKLLVSEVTDEGEATVSADCFDTLRVELHHVHLPKLDDSGLIDWNRDEETVAYVGHPDLDRTWLTPRVIDTADRAAESARLAGRDSLGQ
ncbi:MAG: hypothetical protein ABEI99_00045 [Halobaculum sp.]